MSSPKFDNVLYKQASKDLLTNEEQMQVYNSTGNCVVLAGPGSGKSKILTLKLAKILNEDVAAPQGVACLTYNKECARELKEKLKKLGIVESPRIFIDTVHSFCLNHIIKPYRHLVNTNLPEVIKVATSQQIKDTMIQTFNESIGINEKYNSSWAAAFNVYRRTYVDRNLPEWKNNHIAIAEWVISYERSLRQQGLIDYDDMILNGLWLIKNNRWVRELLQAKFPIIAVDEYQDLGVALDKIIRILCLENSIRLIAVGDPDQSIYGFTGAQPELLKDLANQPNILKVRLKKNYRSKSNIVKASITTLLKERNFISNREGEGIIKFYEVKDGIDAQCDYICKEIIPKILSSDTSSSPGDIGILYNDKNDGDRIAKKLIEIERPYIRVDGNAPYNKNLLTMWIEDCARWCSGGWINGNPSFLSIERTFSSFFFNSGNSEKSLENEKMELFEFLFQTKNTEMKLSKWLQEFNQKIILRFLKFITDIPEIVLEYNKLLESAENGQLKDFNVSSLSRQIKSNTHLNLYTMHSSKGLEFKYVIIFGLEEGRIPWLTVSQNKLDESRRLFYVALTRAEDELHLLYSGWYVDYFDRQVNYGPSRFVLELKEFVEKDLLSKDVLVE